MKNGNHPNSIHDMEIKCFVLNVTKTVKYLT